VTLWTSEMLVSYHNTQHHNPELEYSPMQESHISHHVNLLITPQFQHTDLAEIVLILWSFKYDFYSMQYTI